MRRSWTMSAIAACGLRRHGKPWPNARNGSNAPAPRTDRSTRWSIDADAEPRSRRQSARSAAAIAHRPIGPNAISAEGQTIEREFKSAAELKGELDWALTVLLSADVTGRIAFDEPVPAQAATAQCCNWDVTVCCSPDDDDVVQAAIMHVADRWDLA